MECLISSASVIMSCPATTPAPDVGVIMPQSMRIVVDLPEPLAPRNPNISPFFTEKVILFTATKAPNFFSRFVTEMESEVESIMRQISIHLFNAFNNCFFQSFKTVANTSGSCCIHKNRTMHQSQTIAAFALIQIGCGNDNRHAFIFHTAQYFPEFMPGHRINAVGRLIENQQLRFMYQHTG